MNVAAEPKPEDIEALDVPAMIEFGTSWCGHCARAQASIAAALAAHPGVRHIKVEDGPGRRLGRHYRVKLWPTLVFLAQGREVARLVRPADSAAIEQALAQITQA